MSALRQGTLALSVPAHDSTHAYANLREVAALVQLVVLKPGGLPTDSPTTWQSTLTTARRYYQRSGVWHYSLTVPFLLPLAVADSAEWATQYHGARPARGGRGAAGPQLRHGHRQRSPRLS